MKLYLIIIMLASIGCQDAPSDTRPPLRPLTYTEHPDITPEGAAVKERRLLRQLNAGAVSGWGTLEAPADPPEGAKDVEALAQRITRALLVHDPLLWEASFVTPVNYANLVHVDLDTASAFVDEAMGASRPVWSLFDPPMASEMVDGGFSSVFEFVRFEPGSGRDVQGKPAEGDEIEQYWNSRVVWRYRAQREVELAILLPKVVKSGSDGTWGLAAPVKTEGGLSNLLAAGLHLKPELLRNDEYPFPLKVGNYWKYRRRAKGEPTNASQASQVLEEVVSVDLYGAFRLVKIRRSYNNQELTKTEQTLLLTARRVYDCDRTCRRAAPSLSVLLTYMGTRTPLMRFPFKEADVDVEVSEIETPAGQFSNLVVFDVAGKQICNEAGECGSSKERVTFAVGRGVVHRVTDGGRVDEELVDYRLVP